MANAVDSRHSYFIFSVGVESSDAVACRGDAVHRLILVVWSFGSILDDVVGHRVGVARVPGDGHAGGCGFCDKRCPRSIG